MDYQNKFRETLNRKAEFGAGEGEEGGENDLAEIDRDLQSFQTCVDSIGTPLNNDQNRAEVKRLRSFINRRLRECNTKIKQKGKGVETQQLSKQLTSYAQRFDNLMNQEKDLTRQHQQSVSFNAVDSPEGSEVPMVQTQATATADVVAMEQDAAELRELERDILDLHDIQKDLVTIVQEQGEVTDRIEVQVAQAATRVERGEKRLKDSVVLKSRKRKLIVAISLAVGIPIAVILLVIIIVLAVVLPKDDNN